MQEIELEGGVLMYNKNAPFKLKEKILDCLEIEVNKYWGIEFDYVATEENIDERINFMYCAVKKKREMQDSLNKLIKRFLDNNITLDNE